MSMTVAEAAKKADIIMILVNDERAADIYKESHRPQPGCRQGHGLRPRLQHPLQADRSPRRRRCVHGCSQGPRPHRSRPVCRTARACPAWSPWSRMPPATAYNIALAYIAGIGGARAGVMETTMHDRDRDRPVRRADRSVRRRGRSDAVRLRDPGARPAMRPRTPTSSASTR